MLPQLITEILKGPIMAKRRKEKQTYRYECSLTGEKFSLTKKADNNDELVSVEGYYELNPEEDDRTEAVKKQAKLDQETRIKEAEEREAARLAAMEARLAEKNN